MTPEIIDNYTNRVFPERRWHLVRRRRTPTIRNNLAWQNLPADGVGDCAAWWQSNGNVVVDPYFCNPESSDYSVAQNSPALTHEAGPLGAFHLPGCGPVAVESITWGRLKARYE